MNFLTHRGSLVTDSHVNVTGLFRNTVATAFCTRGEALQDGALFDVDRFHEQFVDVRTIIVLGIRNSGFQNAFDDRSTFFGLNCKMLSAASTFLPRIRSATRRPFWSDRRTP